MNSGDQDDYTALMRAAFCVHLRVAEMLLKAGADVNATTRGGCHATLGEREIQEVGNYANSKEVLRFYRQDLTPPLIRAPAPPR